MVEQEPRLRVVDRAGESPQPEGAAAPPQRGRWLTLALVLALAVCVALLFWSRAQLGAQIEGLQSRVSDLREQVGELRGEVAARDRTIAAHQSRLDDVRGHVDRLRTLLDEPVTSD